MVLFLSLTAIFADGANILILHPIYSGSHEHVLRNVGEHLVQARGHNVTQVGINSVGDVSPVGLLFKHFGSHFWD